MKRKPIALSQRYVAALQNHLRQGSRGSLQTALALRHPAAALTFNLETLDMAGSEFVVESSPGQRTSVQALVPLGKSALGETLR